LIIQLTLRTVGRRAEVLVGVLVGGNYNSRGMAVFTVWFSVRDEPEWVVLDVQ
jgi:hypothetical protein